ncbi:1-acyl-sn-glycerol-3-phosphate acyltransferase 2-like [Hibiscus syriacus]|uniref:1-acyl-sn-glycerol-3-phosphate acyltransferase 2-like n=1 Tax=Hibiscus syriacus TaxID=106335 RepID=UPI00192182AA|nr:1-acyl-sn-glycerol-3-phosphate acyltransferase 2-like [Hibiscus syriacus]
MDIGGIIGGIPVIALFIFTGILINLIQVICYVTIRPMSKSKFRRINGAIAELLWLELVWMMEWWSGFEVKLYTDVKTFHLMGKEHAILMPNHISDSDTLLTWVLAQRVGCLRSALTIVKKETQFLPVFGWTTWFYEFIFVNRNWAKDESKLRSSFEALKDFPMPFWMTIFVEGTRLTSDKLFEAQAFASSKGYPIPKHVLIPKTKGIVTAVQSLRSFVPAIYDVTIAVPKNQPYFPTLLTFFKMQPCKVKVHIKRYPTKDLPESDQGIAQWCRNRFLAKDALLDNFAVTGTFEEDEITEFRRSVKSLIVTLVFIILLLLGGWIYLQRLSTGWRYISLATIIGTVTIVVHIFLEFTKLPPQKNKAHL